MKIIRCLHPDQMPAAIRAVVKQDPQLEKQLLEAGQLFNRVFTSQLEVGPDEVANAPIGKA